ncbi:MAG: ABC transporter substrate-binding protein [Anaerolineae bacterium]|nr:ABC transporter substrate-binding protein [Anaerolineae bacterium]
MRKFHLSLLLIMVLLVGALVPAYAAPQTQDAVKLRMGLLPILDVLPFYVAEQAGYFEAAGLDVELIPVSSALERDQLLIAGEIDGMLNDLISTGIFNQDETLIQIVAMARKAYADSPQFRILAAPRSNITLPSEAAQHEIAISENSVIKYIAQRIMEDAGVNTADLQFRAEPSIPVRFQLLMEGTLKVACLPDPLAQAAIEGGAILIADDSALVETEFSQSVLSFRTPIIEDHPEAVAAFLSVWMQAAAEINADPDAYRDLWLEKTIVPDSVKDSYVLPPFPTYEITDSVAWEDTVEWLVAEGIVDNAATYADSVNPTFLANIAPGDMTMNMGNPVNGEALFVANACSACHALTDEAGAGPGLAGLAVRAGETVEGLSAEEYLRQSMLEPGAYVVEGYANIMTVYSMMPENDLNDLIAYLLTLE